ncbi:MAG: GNAT family N-acetyltransferase [Promethearchaeota archaeon]
MFKSKRGYFASEVLDFQVLDQHSKKVGKVKELLINPISYLIDYLVAGKDYFIPVSLIVNDNFVKKVIILSHTKKQLTRWKKKSYPQKKCKIYTKIRNTMVYDFTGLKLGPIENIAYHTGLRVDLLISRPGIMNSFLQNYFVIPTDYICQIRKDFVTVCIPKNELKTINLTGFEHLFVKDRQDHGDKKRYVIVEAPAATVSYYLHQREENLHEVTEALFIEELEVSNETKLASFIDLFNIIQTTSPDTIIPLSRNDVKKYFKQRTFLVYQSDKAIGYCRVTIEKQEETNQLIGAIAGIGVHPSHRGKYIAMVLIDYSLRHLINSPVDKIQADIYELNIPSLRLFSSLGFREIGDIYLT